MNAESLPPEVLDEWVAALAARLGLDPAQVPIGALLDVTRDAAHNVARPAGPLTTYLIGVAAARDGGTAADAERASAIATELALGWPGRTPDPR
jgi:hypothetical protein